MSVNITLHAARLAQENTSCKGSCYHLNYANNLLEFIDELGQNDAGFFLAKVFQCASILTCFPAPICYTSGSMLS